MSNPGDHGGLTRHVLGSGLEVGPGHNPLVESSSCRSVRYVDRWEPERLAELFPDLEGAVFPKPDVVLDLNRDALAPIPDESEDFVICSHVLEHLANPLRVVVDIHRVLRPGGTLLILLPDRRRTFDQHRLPTTAEHVVADFEADVVEVDDDHIVEFLSNTPGGPETLETLASHPELRDENFDLHRHRSIHVHCWTFEEFVPVIRHSIEALGCRWHFVDGFLTEEMGPDAIEFGLVLRRSPADVPARDATTSFTESVDRWMGAKTADIEERRRAEELNSQLTQDVETLRAEMAELAGAAAQLESARQSIADLDLELRALRATKTFRYSAHLRRFYGRAKGLGLRVRRTLAGRARP